MSWVESYNDWRGVIDEHYGSLSGFEDARSIRILLQAADREERELVAFLAAVEGELPADDPAVVAFTADLAAVRDARDELRRWLEEKGLEP